MISKVDVDGDGMVNFKEFKQMMKVEGNLLRGEDVVENTITEEASSVVEPFIGMEFESEEATKSFYDSYATRTGFVMRVDAFRKSMRDGTVDEKDAKIRELSTELSRERKRCATLQQQLDMVLNVMEEHANHLSVNINNVIQSVKEIESITFTKPLS
ncbi:hypothetical protein IGI04_020867 [Brassica rapa subsp. trilocularis]|uniref:EF-hand domain-containing protein n=1 Tax=Brassica rapa subsp. trilocularis TaxID=1813537 RepID=A0ABQ7MJY8_BRACM|nr:hypothetical protein IGI04_020867 [Brassica rapa subsp. trilocularis]